VAATIGAMAVLFPFEHEVTPGWVFDVVGSDNRALPGCRMQENWEWLAVGLQRDDTAVSDAAGRVRFSRRTVRASFARQWIGTLRGFGFHSAFMGPRAYFLGCASAQSPDRLDAEKVGSEMVYRYVPGSQAPVKPLTGIVEGRAVRLRRGYCRRHSDSVNRERHAAVHCRRTTRWSRRREWDRARRGSSRTLYGQRTKDFGSFLIGAG
jgi:hypothetical protein